jgi:hypothetical protein
MRHDDNQDSRFSSRKTPWVACLLLLLGGAGAWPWGCGGNTQRQFSECCNGGAECASGTCHPTHRACTQQCTADEQCPPEPKSGTPSCKEGLCQAELEGDVCSAGTSSTGSGSTGSGSTGSGVDCTFPNEPSICGCGNACNGNPDSPSYGLCQRCGASGSGCPTDEIWCCSDGDCPNGTLCSTLSTSPNIGYHLCVSSLEPCTTADDCFSGEVCSSGYCRENE